MEDIFTLEVLENFIVNRNTFLGGLILDYTKGDTITVTHAVDDYYQKLISEGKLKLVESFTQEK